MTLGDRVCVLRSGVLQQVDRHRCCTTGPRTSSSAGFIGSPAMNLSRPSWRARRGLAAVFGPHALAVPAASRGRPELPPLRRPAHRPGDPPGGRRGSARSGRSGRARLEVVVDIREDMGSEVYLHFVVQARREGGRAARDRGRGGTRGGRTSRPTTQPVRRPLRGDGGPRGRPVTRAVVTSACTSSISRPGPESTTPPPSASPQSPEQTVSGGSA